MSTFVGNFDVKEIYASLPAIEATPDPYYHVAPSSCYQSILKNGLDFALGTPAFEDAYLLHLDYEAGNYLFNDLLIASEMAEEWESYKGIALDIWQVDCRGLFLYEDPHDDSDFPFSFFSREKISSSRISLEERSPQLTCSS